MPVFAYQSFNANSSAEHDIASLNNQHFTRLAHNAMASQFDKNSMLLYPVLGTMTAKDGPSTPVQGPAQKVDMEDVGAVVKGGTVDTTFLDYLQSKTLQIHQTVVRELGQGIEVFALGEVDTAHSSFGGFSNFIGGAKLNLSTGGKACQNFSVHATSGNNLKMLSGATGWVAIEYLSYVVVFVHVPNAISRKKPDVVSFYRNVRTAIGMDFHLVMGDTNQPSADFTATCVSEALGKTFANAHNAGPINPGDTWNVSVTGTNSTGNRMYDVAVYDTTAIKAPRSSYWSSQAAQQAGGSTRAITDHMGIAILLEKK